MNIVRYMFIILITAWFSTSLIINVLVLPTVFKLVGDVYLGGKIGAMLFSKFHIVELSLAFLLLIMAIIGLIKNYSRILIALIFVVTIVLGVNVFYVTPNIKKTFAMVRESYNQTEKVQLIKKQDKFHSLYIKLDSGKLILLVAGLGLSFGLKRRETNIFY